MAYLGFKTTLSGETDDSSTDEGDLFIDSSGKIGVLVDDTTESKKRAAVQGIQTRLQLVKGEWFYNLIEGIPYFTSILVKNPSFPLIRSIIRQTIFSYPGIVSIPRLELNFEKSTRELTIEFNAVLNGDIEINSDDYGDLVISLNLPGTQVG